MIAPDSFGGTLTPVEAARAIEAGWRRERPSDETILLPLSDGGEGFLEVLAHSAADVVPVEVSGPRGLPVEASFRLEADGSAIIESARACGLSLLAEDERDPLLTTTWGVGELLEAARQAGARHIIVGLGGSATVDGGAGAVTALGFRSLVADGSGLKVGGHDLARVARITSGWEGDWGDIRVDVLADVTTTLPDAAATFGPQKGAGAEDIPRLEAGLRAWADVVEDAFGCPGMRDEPGSGAAGGLAFGLAASIGGRILPGAATIADLVGLSEVIEAADLIVTGEGRLDATSTQGKVVGEVLDRARQAGIEVMAVCGQVVDRPSQLRDVEEASPDGPGPDPAAAVADAAQRLAERT